MLFTMKTSIAGAWLLNNLNEDVPNRFHGQNAAAVAVVELFMHILQAWQMLNEERRLWGTLNALRPTAANSQQKQYSHIYRLQINFVQLHISRNFGSPSWPGSGWGSGSGSWPGLTCTLHLGKISLYFLYFF